MHNVGIQTLKNKRSACVRSAAAAAGETVLVTDRGLATMDFLRGQGVTPAWATDDQRTAEAAAGEGFALVDC